MKEESKIAWNQIIKWNSYETLGAFAINYIRNSFTLINATTPS